MEAAPAGRSLSSTEVLHAAGTMAMRRALRPPGVPARRAILDSAVGLAAPVTKLSMRFGAGTVAMRPPAVPASPRVHGPVSPTGLRRSLPGVRGLGGSPLLRVRPRRSCVPFRSGLRVFTGRLGYGLDSPMLSGPSSLPSSSRRPAQKSGWKLATSSRCSAHSRRNSQKLISSLSPTSPSVAQPRD